MRENLDPKTVEGFGDEWAAFDQSGLKGEEFDQKYMAAMAEDHQKAVDLFQKQSEEGQDAELKSFAEQTLPIIKEHLTQAQSMVQQAQAQ